MVSLIYLGEVKTVVQAVLMKMKHNKTDAKAMIIDGVKLQLQNQQNDR